MSEVKISMYDKVKTLREIREKYKFLIKAENNNSRKELYIKWKQEVEHLIDVITEEKFEMDRQEQANERDFESYRKGV
jgi:spermidine/putrescine-binding protein